MVLHVRMKIIDYYYTSYPLYMTNIFMFFSLASNSFIGDRCNQVLFAVTKMTSLVMCVLHRCRFTVP
jgi:hypothetical protein